MPNTENRTASTEIAEISRDVQYVERPESQAARIGLEKTYADALPHLVSMWLDSKDSPNTRKAYARGFRKWESFCRTADIHPMAAKRPLAERYKNWLEDQGGPNTSRAHAMSSASSFYDYAIEVGAAEYNPFKGVKRPKVDADHTDTEGLTEDEMSRLLVEAHKDSPRAYALVLLLYTLGLRVDGALASDVSDLGYDRGHRTITVTLKGDTKAKLAVPPVTLHALDVYLSGRTSGPLFATRTGGRLDEPAVWRMLRRLAKRAELPQAASIHPHVLRHVFITEALDKGVPLHTVQDTVGHKDPRTTRRYDRARNRLSNSPTYVIGSSIAEKLEILNV